MEKSIILFGHSYFHIWHSFPHYISLAVGLLFHPSCPSVAVGDINGVAYFIFCDYKAYTQQFLKLLSKLERRRYIRSHHGLPRILRNPTNSFFATSRYRMPLISEATGRLEIYGDLSSLLVLESIITYLAALSESRPYRHMPILATIACWFPLPAPSPKSKHALVCLLNATNHSERPAAVV